ncbi:MAG: ComEC/Rec2 family competence protein [Bacteroidia bacterium]
MKALTQAPVFKFVLLYLAGIVLARYFFSWSIVAGISGLGLLAAIRLYYGKNYSFRREYLAAAGIYLVVLGLGSLNYYARTWTADLPVINDVNCGKGELYARVIRPVKKNFRGRSTWAELIAYRKECEWISASGRFLLYIDVRDTSSLGRFDEVLIRGNVTDAYTANEGYLQYLHNQGIFHTVYADAIQVSGKKKGWDVSLETMRQEMCEQLKQVIPDSTAGAIAQAMFLGEKGEMSKEVKDAFSVAGVSHILAISGLHVGIVFLVLNHIFSLLHLVPFGLKIKNAIILIFLLGYMLMTGASPAVVRAVLMFGIVLIFRIFYLRYSMLNIVGTAGLIQLLADPVIAFDAGFQLSYSAVVGIIVLFPIFEAQFSAHHFLLKTLYAWIGVTFCATIATLPLIILHFGKFPTYFLLSNILVASLAFVLVLVGFFTVVLCSVPVLGEWLGFFCQRLIGYLYTIVTLIGALPSPVIDEWQDYQGFLIMAGELGIAGLILVIGKRIQNSK